MREYFETLGLAPGATQGQVKKAYRKLAMRYHPDRNSDPGAEDVFIELTEAYEVLMGEREPEPEVYEPAPSYSNEPGYSNQQNTYASYEEQQRVKQEWARQHAREAYEAFRRNNQAFRDSWYFWPAVILTYTIVAVSFFIGIWIMVSPFLAEPPEPHEEDRRPSLIALPIFIGFGIMPIIIGWTIKKKSDEYFWD
ncbi:MAG: J domain-containing protein [Bacteroidota bacterium]